MGAVMEARFFLCARHKHKLVTVHGATTNRKHLPPTSRSRHALWRGPYPSADEAQDAAQSWADTLDYDVTRCGNCFRQQRAQERKARADWMPTVGRRPSRSGIARRR